MVWFNQSATFSFTLVDDSHPITVCLYYGSYETWSNLKWLVWILYCFFVGYVFRIRSSPTLWSPFNARALSIANVWVGKFVIFNFTAFDAISQSSPVVWSERSRWNLSVFVGAHLVDALTGVPYYLHWLFFGLPTNFTQTLSNSCE